MSLCLVSVFFNVSLVPYLTRHVVCVALSLEHTLCISTYSPCQRPTGRSFKHCTLDSNAAIKTLKSSTGLLGSSRSASTSRCQQHRPPQNPSVLLLLGLSHLIFCFLSLSLFGTLPEWKRESGDAFGCCQKMWQKHISPIRRKDKSLMLF